MKRKNAIRLPARAAAWYVISSIISRGVGVLGTPLFTRLLSPTEYGLYPLYNGYLSILTVIASLELTGSVLYRELQLKNGEKCETLCSALLPCLALLTVLSGIYLIFHDSINNFTGLTTSVSIILIGQALINVITALYTAGARYEYKYKSVALINLFAALGAPTISVMLIKIVGLRAEARIIGLLIATGCTAIALSPGLLRGYKGLFNIPRAKRLVKSGLPLLPYFLSFTLIIRVNELTIGRFLGTGVLGGYSIAVSLGTSLNILSLGILSALNPWLTRKLRSGRTDNVKDMLMLCFYAMCLAAVMLLGIMPEIIKFVIPPDFHYCLPYVYPLCLSVIPAFISGALSSAVSFFGKGGETSLYAIAVAAIASMLSVTTISLLGAMAGAIITLCSYIALSISNCLVYKGATDQLPLSPIKCVCAFIATAFFCSLMYSFRAIVASRVLLLAATLPLCFTLAKRVVKSVKEQ